MRQSPHKMRYYHGYLISLFQERVEFSYPDRWDQEIHHPQNFVTF